MAVAPEKAETPALQQKRPRICDENISDYQREKIGCDKTPTPAPAPALEQRAPSSLCDDKQISFHQRQKLGCKD